MNYAYEELSQHIIRPNRSYYQIAELGSQSLNIAGHQVMRQDLQIVNAFKQAIQCSFFSIVGKANSPCIVYSHCNSGNRLEALMYLNKFIENGIQLCCFDFHGCGLSEGNYVSLGFHESWDIEAVVNFLRGTGQVGKIILWGRSMGSVATLIYAARDAYISGIVVDSPFKSLKKMILELAQSHYTLIPKFLLSYVISKMEKYIQKTVNFKFTDLEVLNYSQNCKMYGIFITSEEDEIVNHKQVNELYQRYGGQKQIIYTSGGHNNYRNEELQQQIISMLKLHALKDFSFRDKFKGFYLDQTKNSNNERSYSSNSHQQSYYQNYNLYSSPSSSFRQSIALPMTTKNSYQFSPMHVLYQNHAQQMKQSYFSETQPMARTMTF